MLITSDLIRGHTETIILAQLMPHDSYGYEINKAIHEKTGGRYESKEATLYSAYPQRCPLSLCIKMEQMVVCPFFANYPLSFLQNSQFNEKFDTAKWLKYYKK